MEEDILEDIRLKLIKYKIDFPDYILWIRPTTPLRDLSALIRLTKFFSKQIKLCVLLVDLSQEFFMIVKFSKTIFKKYLKINQW